MTTYEMQKIAKYQAEYLVEALKKDDELLDLVFPPRCMTIEEASEFVRIPVSTIYQKIGQIPHQKVGKRLVFTDRGLMRWIRRENNRSSVEIPLDVQIKKVM